MIIEKTARQVNTCRSPILFLNSAREGEEIILDYYCKKGNYTLLLPAYIGYSPREGSGIYDPVVTTGIKHSFYRINKDICIDINDLEKKLSEFGEKCIVLLVHYFGYPDPNLEKAAELCHRYSAVIIEDSAHALFTDFVDHSCGMYGDYILYSIHKMLPYEHGGILKVIDNKNSILDVVQKGATSYSVFDYDFMEISRIRKRNAFLWKELIERDNFSKIHILRKNYESVTPQTFPITVDGYNRDALYFELNQAGFGAVSLYHTMIDPIKTAYEDSVWISKHVMNLPVHQDIGEKDILRMYKKMAELLA